MEDSTSWLAPAKINLFLRITGQRADGMHELQTAFQFIDLCDELRFSINDGSEILRTTAIKNLSSKDDLCVRAAKLLQQHAGVSQGVDIAIKKMIPMGGGLGGASSDAATTLLVLNKLWSINDSVDRLAELGESLGADVPVFIRGQAAWAGRCTVGETDRIDCPARKSGRCIAGASWRRGTG